MKQPLILNSVCKSYKGKEVLRDYSQRFPASGVVAVMGPSGVGKTTLLRLIAGLEQPDRGSILHSEPLRIAMVFQEDRLLPSLTAKENILAVMEDSSAENARLAEDYLDRMGLTGEGEKLPCQLSGGMRRRIAIARAMAYGGDLLLMDEPFKGMDAGLKRRVMEFALGGHKPTGQLIVFITHDDVEAEFASQIIRLPNP